MKRAQDQNQRVNRSEHKAAGGKDRDHGIHREGAQQNQEFTDEITQARQAQ